VKRIKKTATGWQHLLGKSSFVIFFIVTVSTIFDKTNTALVRIRKFKNITNVLFLTFD